MPAESASRICFSIVRTEPIDIFILHARISENTHCSGNTMKVAFDVDGVVIRSIEIILEHINRIAGRDIKPDDLRAWDLEPLGLDDKTLAKAVKIMYEQPMIQPYHGAVAVLSKIHRMTSEPLLFITGRSDPDTARRQLEALPWNPTIPEMIVTGGDRDKRVFISDHGVDFIIEDDIKHVRDYLDSGIGVGLMLQPWNRETCIPGSLRFNGWRDVETWFAGLHADRNS